MAFRADKDKNGTTYIIEPDTIKKTPGGIHLPGCAEVQVWWSRKFKQHKAAETLLIRQENNRIRADVIELTLGQVYDLIHAANQAVENK
jgi:hypothetical protein